MLRPLKRPGRARTVMATMSSGISSSGHFFTASVPSTEISPKSIMSALKPLSHIFLRHMMATRTTRVFFVYRRIRIRFWIARPPAQVMGTSPGVITPGQPGGGVGR